VERRTLSLKPRVDPATKPKLDPAKAALSEQLGIRFVDRGGRYIAQKLVVVYGFIPNGDPLMPREHGELSRSWFDIPLVPETYYP
jgi:hypothetical protein